MHPHGLRMIEVDQLHVSEQQDHDLEPVTGASLEDLDPNLVHALVERARASSGRLRDRDDAEVLRRLSVVTDAGVPTRSGLYAVGDYPQGRFPALTVTAAVRLFDEGEERRLRDKRDFTGPLPDLLDGIMEWAARNVPTVRRYESSGHMREARRGPIPAHGPHAQPIDQSNQERARHPAGVAGWPIDESATRRGDWIEDSPDPPRPESPDGGRRGADGRAAGVAGDDLPAVTPVRWRQHSPAEGDRDAARPQCPPRRVASRR